MGIRLRPTGVVLFLLCLMYGITYMDRVNVSTAAGVFGKELHLSNTQVGFVFSAFGIPYLLFQIVGGWVGDRFGARLALTVAGVIWSVGTVMTGLAGSLTTLLGARLVLGFGEGATFPVATRAMSDWTTPSRRGFAQGITHSAARLGNAITPPIVAALIGLAGWRGSFLVMGGLSLVWTLVWALYFRDNPAEHPSITREDIKRLPAFRSREERLREPVPWNALVRRMLPVTIVYFCYGWTLWLYLSWIPQYFAQSYKLNLRDSSLFAAGVFFGGVVGDTLGGLVTDRVYERTGSRDKARRTLVVFGFLCSLASMLPIMFVHDVTVAAVCLSAAFFFSEFTIGPMWAIPMDIAPKYAGTASGLMNTGSAFAAIVSPVIAGYVIDKTGIWELPFNGSIVLLLLGTFLAFRMKPGEELAVPGRRAYGEATA
jgi:ACS family glucarate transporter-like MFS transporter